MNTVGIICEYNPLHVGHKKQLDLLRRRDADDTIVCLMSGNFVQRGAPAVFHRSLRAKAAILSGADLVLEMPVTISLSSAEGFAAGSVSILSSLCDELCFGAENADASALMDAARALLSDAPVLLLDEATSALDVKTEQELLEKIQKSRKGRTCIVTTHKASVQSICHRVYLVQDQAVTRVENAQMEQNKK